MNTLRKFPAGAEQVGGSLRLTLIVPIWFVGGMGVVMFVVPHLTSINAAAMAMPTETKGRLDESRR
jgi:hypothetical protein